MIDLIAVNVKLRVSPELRETVIIPNQKVRRLSGLIVQLLEGYRDNPYIRQWVDGARTGEDDTIQAQLLQELEDAEKRLNALSTLPQLSIDSPLSHSSNLEDRLSELENRVRVLEEGTTLAPTSQPSVVNEEVFNHELVDEVEDWDFDLSASEPESVDGEESDDEPSAEFASLAESLFG